jgi:hypothetical protein
VTVVDKDNGYKALTKRIWGMGRPSIAVGILTGQGAEERHAASAGPQKTEAKESLTTLQVAIWNEFGTARMPSRSFIRAWFDEKAGELRGDMRKLMVLVVAGKMSKEQALELIAVRAVGQIQERMAAGVPPPNFPTTVARKGSSTPLIDTGQLRASITSRVDPG